MLSHLSSILQKLFFLLILFVSIWGCSDSADSKSASKAAKPTTPEAVFRSWQVHIDRNEFAEAKALSTPSTVEWINMISAMLFEDIESEEVLLTNFQKMRCTEQGDSARCVYTIFEEGLHITDSVVLVRTDRQWLVDFADEEELNEEETEEIQKELQELLEKAGQETE